MLMMKACPRCSGDLLRMRDPYEDEAMFSCVQCGYASYCPMAVRNNVEADSNTPVSPVVISALPDSDLDAIEEPEGAAA